MPCIVNQKLPVDSHKDRRVGLVDKYLHFQMHARLAVCLLSKKTVCRLLQSRHIFWLDKIGVDVHYSRILRNSTVNTKFFQKNSAFTVENQKITGFFAFFALPQPYFLERAILLPSGVFSNHNRG